MRKIRNPKLIGTWIADLITANGYLTEAGRLSPHRAREGKIVKKVSDTAEAVPHIRAE